jgi:hypothetical protein
MGINEMYHCPLFLEVILVVLNDTQGIDPEVSNSDLLGDLDSVLEGLWKIGDPNTMVVESVLMYFWSFK